MRVTHNNQGHLPGSPIPVKGEKVSDMLSKTDWIEFILKRIAIVILIVDFFSPFVTAKQDPFDLCLIVDEAELFGG
jgi:hypothetical protein